MDVVPGMTKRSFLTASGGIIVSFEDRDKIQRMVCASDVMWVKMTIKAVCNHIMNVPTSKNKTEKANKTLQLTPGNIP